MVHSSNFSTRLRKQKKNILFIFQESVFCSLVSVLLTVISNIHIHVYESIKLISIFVCGSLDKMFPLHV